MRENLVDQLLLKYSDQHQQQCRRSKSLKSPNAWFEHVYMSKCTELLVMRMVRYLHPVANKREIKALFINIYNKRLIICST